MKITQNIDVLERALKRMPPKFSSVRFIAEVNYLMGDKSASKGNGVNLWLKERCDNTSRSAWIKRDALVAKTQLLTLGLNQDDVENAIKLLKSKGYKIMKPIT